MEKEKPTALQESLKKESNELQATKPELGSKAKNKYADHQALVNQILVGLNLLHVGRFWPQQTGAAYRNGRLIHYGFTGSADITGIMKGGYRVEIEVKTGRASQSNVQKNFEQNIKMWGGIYFVARSVEDALSKIKAYARKYKI
jgi:hypothetical protein